MKGPAIRPDRLRRAWSLVKGGLVKRMDDGTFLVAGNTEPTYHVDLNGDPPCYCRDMEYRGTAIRHFCKHVGAARIANQEPAVLMSLISIMQFTEDEDNG